MDTRQAVEILREFEDEIDLECHRYQQQSMAAPPSSKLQAQLQQLVNQRRRQHDAVRHARTLLQKAIEHEQTA